VFPSQPQLEGPIHDHSYYSVHCTAGQPDQQHLPQTAQSHSFDECGPYTVRESQDATYEQSGAFFQGTGQVLRPEMNHIGGRRNLYSSMNGMPREPQTFEHLRPHGSQAFSRTGSDLGPDGPRSVLNDNRLRMPHIQERTSAQGETSVADARLGSDSELTHRSGTHEYETQPFPAPAQGSGPYRLESQGSYRYERDQAKYPRQNRSSASMRSTRPQMRNSAIASSNQVSGDPVSPSYLQQSQGSINLANARYPRSDTSLQHGDQSPSRAALSTDTGIRHPSVSSPGHRHSSVSLTLQEHHAGRRPALHARTYHSANKLDLSSGQDHSSLQRQSSIMTAPSAFNASLMAPAIHRRKRHSPPESHSSQSMMLKPHSTSSSCNIVEPRKQHSRKKKKGNQSEAETTEPREMPRRRKGRNGPLNCE